MPFVKVVKNKAYFKRFQVKYRRRREGKTDYQARTNLIRQDKNKYNSPKYRFVVRFTNKDIITQIVYAKITGDFVVAAAYAHELPRYGISLGLTNYAAAYATGLLCARRLLHKYKLGDKYQGNTKVDGSLYIVDALEDENAPRPFRALLDVGLRRTTTGNRIFGALKGLADGGVEIPHNDRRFPGYDAAEKKLNVETHKKHIFGGNVADFMKHLQAENPEVFKKHFSRYIKAGIKADDLEKLYKKAHEAIRKDPAHVKKEKKSKAPFKTYKVARLSLAQRRDKIKQKINTKVNAAAKKA